MNKELERLLALAKERKIDEESQEIQRINFAFGNAPDGDQSTKETVRAASELMRK